MLLRAFASGCTAMTGIEAVSNAIPLFRKPAVPNAQWTLTIIVAILGAFLLAIGYLCPAYHIRAMNEQQPGYQTIFSQLIGAIAGHGLFYYIAIASIFAVLVFSAQTSFAGFPRVCRQLAEDGFLPSFFAERGRRLVFSSGIIILAILSGILLIVFRGVTDKLIPLFAIGAFSAFAFSQIGMVFHWQRKKGRTARTKLVINAIGAAATSVALVIIVVAKFAEGAWIILLVGPGAVWLFWKIKRHYEFVPRLQINHSPYRQIYEPILKFVQKKEQENKDRIIAVVIPELVEPHWYERLLHNIRGAGLRALLFLQGDRRTVVIMTPWYLRE